MTIANRGQYVREGWETFQQNIKNANSPRVLSDSEATEYIARVVFIGLNTNPKSVEQKRYFIIARREKRDSNIPEPEFYDEENIGPEHIAGLKKYFPSCTSIEIPQLGQFIRVSITDENSSVGTYLGPKKRFEFSDKIGEVSERKRTGSSFDVFGE